MTVDELIAAAAPAHTHRPVPVQRVEHACHTDEDGEYRLVATYVCPDGHPSVVEPLL